MTALDRVARGAVIEDERVGAISVKAGGQLERVKEWREQRGILDGGGSLPAGICNETMPVLYVAVRNEIALARGMQPKPHTVQPDLRNIYLNAPHRFILTTLEE